MDKPEFIFSEDLAPYINCIMVGSDDDEKGHTNIPIYADGYPGIMFQRSENGFYLLPKGKLLSELFLYGQTIDPISLDVQGKHRYIVVQLYPFASKYLLNVDPKALNDDCYDLLLIDYMDVEKYRKQLYESKSTSNDIEIISEMMRQLIHVHSVPQNDSIQQAISLILHHKGQIKVKDITDQVYMTERTLERNFKSHVGLSPKQFAKIIQFQTSIHSLTESTYQNLLDVGLDSGFADQSHFIRTFKSYTGQTPSYFLQQLGS